MNSFKSSVLAIASIFFVTACGGGGGSSTAKSTSGTTQQPVYSFELSSDSVDMGESVNNSDITISATNGTGATYTFESSDSLLVPTINGSEITLTASDFDRNKEISVKVTGTSNGQVVEQTLTVNVENTSGIEVVEYATRLTDSKDLISDFKDQKDLFGFMMEIAEFSGRIDNETIETFKDDFNAKVESEIIVVEDLLTDLSASVDSYSKGDIADTELETAIELAMELALKSHVNVVSIANEAAAEMNLDKSVSAEALAKTDTGTEVFYSIFIGNDELGEYDNDVWVFTGENEYLNKVLSRSQLPQTCDA